MTEAAAGTTAEQVISSAEALAEILELGTERGVRVLEAGDELVVLERVKKDGGPGLPVQGPPALAADVGTYPLAELFHWLETSRKSGLFHFVHRAQAKNVFLHQGEVVFASSNQLVDRLGESLLRAGVINLEQLREAQRYFTPNARMGKILVERGFLTPRELWNGVKYQVEEIVRSLFAYTGGRVYFWEGEVQPDNVVRLSLPTHRLVSEGIQRREELAKFLEVLEDPRVHLAAVKEVDAELSGPERALANAIPEEPSFAGLCERLELDRESAARSVQLLRLVGAVKLTRPRDEGGDYMSPSDLEGRDEDGLYETAQQLVKLIAELAAPIVAADGDDGLEERLSSTLEDAATRFPGLLNGVALGPGASLDPEELVDRARRLSGDREAQLTAGVGELVAYLEFEIMNHPGIDDPQLVLESVSDLRAAMGV